jgi:predicted metallopeptidase
MIIIHEIIFTPITLSGTFKGQGGSCHYRQHDHLFAWYGFDLFGSSSSQ